MGPMLEQFASAFAGVFGAFYDSGTLHRHAQTKQPGGTITSVVTDHPVKYQLDQRAQRPQADGQIESNGRIIILATDVPDGIVKDDDELTDKAGRTWRLSAAACDPLESHFVADIRRKP
jgi:hypothetical protein